MHFFFTIRFIMFVILSFSILYTKCSIQFHCDAWKIAKNKCQVAGNSKHLTDWIFQIRFQRKPFPQIESLQFYTRIIICLSVHHFVLSVDNFLPIHIMNHRSKFSISYHQHICSIFEILNENIKINFHWHVKLLAVVLPNHGPSYV